MGTSILSLNTVQMFLRVLLVSTLLGVSLADSLVAQLHISEHGAEYDETVEYDPATKAVTYHVPKHHDIVESTTIIHTPSNSMITLSENKICLLSSSPVGYNPELSVMKTFSTSANNITVSTENVRTTFQLDYFKGNISEERRAGLLEAMQTLCKDVDIEEIEEITVSEAEFNRQSVDPTHSDSSKRVKRERIGRRCKWYWNVDPKNARKFDVTHVRNNQWSCVSCCPTKRNGSMCKCDAIVDEDSFKRCQNGLA